MNMGREVKTNAMRILEQKGIDYNEYRLDLAEAVGGFSCAKMLGVD